MDEIRRQGASRPDPLGHLLSDAAFQEIRRLEGSPGEVLESWRELNRNLRHMSESEKEARVLSLARASIADISGRFNHQIYKLATRILPGTFGAILSPRSLAPGIPSPLELEDRFTIQGPIETLKRCAQRGTLVFVPTHLSNLDSAVVGWALHRIGLPAVVYGAGKNLFTNPVIGFFLRNLGAYRVDRRLKYQLYKDVLKTYSTVLLIRGYHSLFFPGGGRSYDGAVESRLKLGLLGSVLSAWEHNVSAGETQKRFYVVPATLNFMISLEAESLIRYHLATEGKERFVDGADESTKIFSILHFIIKTLSLDGSIVVRFGRPLDPFGNQIDDAGESIEPGGRRVDPVRYLMDGSGEPRTDRQRDEVYTRELGDSIVGAYRRDTILMPTHVVARVLFDHFAAARGIRDIYHLLQSKVAEPVSRELVTADVARWRDALLRHPGIGEVVTQCLVDEPGTLVDRALRAFNAYHDRPPAVHRGAGIWIQNLPLLYYYKNRTNHLVAPQETSLTPARGEEEDL